MTFIGVFIILFGILCTVIGIFSLKANPTYLINYLFLLGGIIATYLGFLIFQNPKVEKNLLIGVKKKIEKLNSNHL